MGETFDPFSGCLVLRFEETRYAGTEIKVRLDVEMGAFLEYAALTTVVDQMQWMADNEVLVSWNIARDGKPWPATGENLKKLPLGLARHLGFNYSRAANEPTAPFGPPSPNGATSAEPSIATGTSSRRRRSSTAR